jgi:prepilin-type N-terminal cleavage/methylation domain-containing protein
MVKRVAQDSMLTFQVRTFRTIRPGSYKQRGFTLIEVLITLGIIAFVVAVAVPKLTRSLGTQIRSTTRRIVTLNKELHNNSELKDKTYRLVIDFGGEKHKPSIKVESATSSQLIADPSASPPEKVTKERAKDSPPDTSGFSEDKEILKKPIELPEGVQFEDVENDSSEKPITEDKAYVIFFPQGMVQRTIIHLTDGKKIHWSLVINPLSGQTDIVNEYVKIKDLNKE